MVLAAFFLYSLYKFFVFNEELLSLQLTTAIQPDKTGQLPEVWFKIA